MQDGVDGSNNIWVTNLRGASVTKLNDTGSVLGTFTVGGNPISIALDNDGNAWVTNYYGNVFKLSPSGNVLGSYTTGSDPWVLSLMEAIMCG
jgi:DNA-binding beta-propeller fold protein YncE